MDVTCGGSVEVFSNEEDARKRYDYLKGVTTAASFLAKYDYLHGLTLVRISHILTPAQAARYESALEGQ